MWLPRQRLAGDPDLSGGAVELLQLRGDLPLPFLQPCQNRTEGELIAPHGVCQDGAVAPVSRRSITAVIAQYTRDSEVRGWCS